MTVLKARAATPEMPHTEAAVQNVLARRCMRELGHELAVPNTMVFQWESDLVSVTKAELLHEFEIKVSRSDFLAEMRDERRSRCKWNRHRSLQAGLDVTPRGRNLRPSYFWFAVTPGVCETHEVPEYAGLLLVDGYCATVERPAPRLHREKVCAAIRDGLGRGLAFRYWDMRHGAGK